MRKAVEEGKAGKLNYRTTRAKIDTISMVLRFPECRRLALELAATKPKTGVVYCGQLGEQTSKDKFCTLEAGLDVDGQHIKCTFHLNQATKATKIAQLPQVPQLPQTKAPKKKTEEYKTPKISPVSLDQKLEEKRANEVKSAKLEIELAIAYGVPPSASALKIVADAEAKVCGKHRRSSLDENLESKTKRSKVKAGKSILVE